jgi:phage terminase large subunit
MAQPKPDFEVKISKKVFNEVYLYSLHDTTRTQIFFGGASAGKSQFIVGQRTVWDLMAGGRNYLIIRNVGRTSRTSTFNQVKQTISDWKVGHLFKINLSEMVITCIANGYQALFEGLDNVEKLKSIVPAKGVITDIVIEEATETKHDDVKQLAKRLRGRSDKPKRMVLLFNPILKSHWIHKTYFKGRFYDNDVCYSDDRLFILKTTYKDNRFLEGDDIAELENEENEYFYNVYTLGNWGVLGGVIFTNWRVTDLTDMIPQFDNIRNGLDFGYAADPMAYNRMHLDMMRKKIYIFEELHHLELTNPEIAFLLEPIIGNELITCDSAEPKSIKELQNCGIRAIGAKKGKDSVNHGIQFLQQFEVIIDRRCQETINEWEQYQWKQDKDGNVLPVPVDKNNHHIDDVRYALERDMADLKVTPKVTHVSASKEKELHKEKPETKPGQSLVAVWEGDKIVGYEVIGGHGRPLVGGPGLTGGLGG